MGFDYDGNLHNLCRLCLRPFTHCPESSRRKSRTSSCKKPEETLQNSHSLLIPKLRKLFIQLTTFNVKEEIENFPKSLCTSCREKLMEYDELRKLAIESTKRLHEMWSNSLEQANNEKDEITRINSIKEEFIEPEPVAEDQFEDDDDDDDDQLLLPELANMMTMNIKVEPDNPYMLSSYFRNDSPILAVQTDVRSTDKSLKKAFFKCNVCNHAYPTKDKLQEHVRLHMVSCPHCSKILSCMSTLNRHVRVVHKGVKEFVCSFCPKSFPTLVSTFNHERRHTGERPHKCEICGKGFVQQIAFQIHIKSHEKEKHDCQWDLQTKSVKKSSLRDRAKNKRFSC